MRTLLRTMVLAALAAAAGIQFALMTNANAQCGNTVRVRPSDEVLISFDTAAPPIKRIEPDYFGFNIEWPGFQADLWDSGTGSVHPDVAGWLKRMDGAIYRYPGGTVANVFQWRNAVGANRRAQKAVDWTGPIRMEFGIDEYFRFLQAVGGKAWFVANLYGEFDREQPIAHQASEADALAAAVGQLAATSMVPVVRWELGNELDRGQKGWSAEKYAANANAVATAIRSAEPNAKFVAMWPDYDAFPGVPAVEYIRRMDATLNPAISDFAQHMYFDGPPGGPPVPNQLNYMCRLINSAQARGKSPAVWVSEFARWPPGKVEDPEWARGFPLTANLSSAISTADFLIGTTQIKEIRGSMIHSLSSSKGPWPMFHRHGEHFDPSAVMLSLVLLRQGLVGDVLPTDVASPNEPRSNNPLVRAAAVAAPDKKTLWLTLVNRGNSRTSARVRGNPSPDFARMRIGEIVGIHDEIALANNYARGDRVTTTSISAQSLALRQGKDLTVDLFPNSITVLRLDR